MVHIFVILCALSFVSLSGENLANKGPKDTGHGNGPNSADSSAESNQGADKGLSHSKRWAIQYEAAWERLKLMAEQNDTFASIMDNHFRLYNHEPLAEEERAAKAFSCSLPPSGSIPENAHAVRPGDIKVVASIGDSITAGYGITATNILQILRNDRQESWSSGGILSLEEGIITTPNIFRQFSSRVSGFSWAESKAGDIEAGLNVAVGGGIAEEMYDQAVHLTQLMYNEGPKMGVDWENDWKIVNFLVGGNDLCSVCDDLEAHSPEAYGLNVRRAIDYLYNNGPPKMIVTINTIFDITALPAFSDGIVCDVVQWFVCGCATSSSNHAMLQKAQRDYHDQLEEMVSSGRWDRPERPDFTVVFIPHLQNARPPTTESGEVDQSYWAVDCFHPGKKAHKVLTISLWNQLFVDEGNRLRAMDWSLSADDIFCPSEDDPYIKTRLNSGSSALTKNEQQEGKITKGSSASFGKSDPLPQRSRSEDQADQGAIHVSEQGNIQGMGIAARGFIRPPFRSRSGTFRFPVPSQNDGEENTAAIVGGTVGGTLVLVSLVLLGITLTVMARKRKRDDEQPFEMK